AEALGTTDLNGGALFNAEFGIRHRGSTVPERSGVALSFCRRPGNIEFQSVNDYGGLDKHSSSLSD
ncbi:hypothetical protein KGZ19_04265, partial [Pseudomonas aeruginosa]|nr:hypothetical protein [Pseudomonas aeruginosa]